MRPNVGQGEGDKEPQPGGRINLVPIRSLELSRWSITKGHGAQSQLHFYSPTKIKLLFTITLMRPGLTLSVSHSAPQTGPSAAHRLHNMQPILTNTHLVLSSAVAVQDAVAGRNDDNVSIDVGYCQCVAAHGLDAIEKL